MVIEDGADGQHPAHHRKGKVSKRWEQSWWARRQAKGVEGVGREGGREGGEGRHGPLLALPLVYSAYLKREERRTRFGEVKRGRK